MKFSRSDTNPTFLYNTPLPKGNESVEIKIGDLIQCRDNHYNQGLGIVNQIGMVAELRRKDVRILFDVDNQAIWLPKTGVNRITLPPTDSPTLLERLTWIIRLLEAGECELTLDDSGNYQYAVVCGELPVEKIDAVRDYMGSLVEDLRIVPRGMSLLALEVTFRRENTAMF